VPFAHQVLERVPDIPFVWHFKEGPFICLEQGTWPQLVELYARADGQVYCNEATAAWFDSVQPRASDRTRLILDGDLPKRDWFTDRRRPRRSESDDGLHTVVAGRPIGLHPADVATLAAQNVHLHFYGDFTQGQWREWIAKAERLAASHLHLHPAVDQRAWTEEFSQYDAGWLHVFKSENAGELQRVNWDDLNYPARLATYAAAGLPWLLQANPSAMVATECLARKLDVGLFFDEFTEVSTRLRDQAALSEAQANMWQARDSFTFDHHVDRLIEFFSTVMERKHGTDPQGNFVVTGEERA
jgi:hypothetical protein